MATASKLLRKLRSGKKLSVFVLLWLPFVWVALGLARFAIILFQFKNLSRLFGSRDGLAAAVPLVSSRQLDRAFKIRKCLKVAARNTPWTSNCFPQAIVARALLGLYRIPYSLYFGLDKTPDDQGLKAHAWVSSGPCFVAGGDGFATYTVVACYGAQSWQPVRSQ